MNWLNNFVRPKIRALVQPKEVPDNMWSKCPNCGAMLFRREVEANLNVCHHCDHHLRLPVARRLETLFDNGEFAKIELPKEPVDPLKFRDQKRYTERLKEAQSKTGDSDAVIVAHGTIRGHPSVVAAFNFAFMGGSMGVAAGEALLAAAKLAVVQRAGLIAIPASGGARMQEGILSLMQMPRSVLAIDQVKEAGLPYIVLLTDPTTGGVTASFAMLGDLHIAEPGAQIGFAGSRVIEETIRESLPDGFQTAEYLRDHGMVDMVVHRRHVPDTLGRLLGLFLAPDAPAQVIALPVEQGEVATEITAPEDSPTEEQAATPPPAQ